MKHLFKPFIILTILSVTAISCSDDDDDVAPTTPNNQAATVSVNPFSTTIDENPLNGTVLGTVQATLSNSSGTLNYGWETPTLGLDVNQTTGEVFVSDSTYFDYELNTSLNATVVAFIDGMSTTFDTAQVVINLNNVVETSEMSVQKRLINGQTPFEIYQSDNSLLDSLYGKTYEGGLIFYLNTSNGAGLVAAETDQSAGIAWDTTSNNANIIQTGATSKAIGDGSSNTNTIVNSLSAQGDYAAELCDNLSLNAKTDWFLPSADEADAMFTNLQSKGFGGFASERYWTSSETTFGFGGAAWYRNFDVSASQISGTTPKIAQYHVRAARAF